MQEFHGHPFTFRTTFGIVRTYDYGSVTVTGDASQLWAWSHRSGAAWPCSYLDDCDEVSADFDSRGDLVDLIASPAVDDGDGDLDIPADELSAWTTDVLIAAGMGDHPAVRR